MRKDSHKVGYRSFPNFFHRLGKDALDDLSVLKTTQFGVYYVDVKFLYAHQNTRPPYINHACHSDQVGTYTE